MDELFNAGGELVKNAFIGVISTVSSYYKEKNNDKKYKKLLENLENNRKEVEKRLMEFTEKKIKTSTYIQDEVLVRYNTAFLKSTLKSLFTELKIVDSIKQEIENDLKSNEFTKKLNHFNILILGRAGIGKTTLINSILEFEGTPKELLTGEGTSKTIGEPKGYISDKVKGIRLWDSQGIDKEKYNIPKVVESVKKLINEASLNNDPDLFIHCIWYCISGNRFEKLESESISELMSIYDDDTLPIIIVYTEAYSENSTKEVCDEVKKVLDKVVDKQKIKEINIVPIVAKDKEIKLRNISTTIEKFGIKPLMDISIKKIKLAVNSAGFFSFKNKLKKDYENKIQTKCTKIKKDINEKVEKFLLGNTISDLKSLNSSMIKYNVIKKLLGTTISDKGKDKDMLNKIFKDFQDFINSECDNNLPHFLSRCISEAVIEYKNENIEKLEEDNEDEMNIKEKLNRYTINYVLNIKKEKGNEKKKNIESGGGQEDTVFNRIRKCYLEHIIKILSKYLDNTITDEISKLMIQTYNEMVNNYDKIIQDKVQESMNQQSLNIMKEFKFE